MLFAARLGDPHVCPIHGGGALLPGPMPPPRVLTMGVPQMCLGDFAICPIPVPPNMVVKGSMTVIAGGRPTARIMDNTAHGGMVSMGAPTVFIGG